MKYCFALGLALVLVPAQAAPLAFETYIQLHPDLTQAQALLISGPPEKIESIQDDDGETLLRQVWLGNAAIPYTTQLNFRRGVLLSLKRYPYQNASEH